MDITKQIKKAVVLEPPYPFLDENKQQRVDRDGNPISKVRVAFVGGDDVRANVEVVKVLEVQGEYEPLAEARLEGFAFAPWSFNDKSGVSWTATRIVIGAAK